MNGTLQVTETENLIQKLQQQDSICVNVISRKILTTILLLGMMTSACTNASINNDVTTKSPAQASCGDQGESEVWWPVFVNNGNLEKIQQDFCRDAIVKKRADGTPSVQLASFKTKKKAQAFAERVNGKVGSRSGISKDDSERQATTQAPDNSGDNREQTPADVSENDSERQATTQEPDNSGDNREQTPVYIPPAIPSYSPPPTVARDGYLFDRDSSGNCTTYANGCND